MERRIRLTAKSTLYLISSIAVIAIVIFAYTKFNISKKEVKVEQIQVGEKLINEDMIRYQMAVNTIMIPQATSYDFARKQLVEMHTNELIMARYNWPITREHLDKEMQRIFRNSSSPEMINSILQIKGHPSDYFLNIFIKSVLVSRLIFDDFYFSTNAIHADTQKIAEDLAMKLKDLSAQETKKFIINAQYNAFDIKITSIDGYTSNQIFPVREANNPGADPVKKETTNKRNLQASDEWIKAHANMKLIEGMFLHNRGQSWELFIPEQWEPARKNIKGISVIIPKRPFSEWIQEETKNVQSIKSGATPVY